MDNRFAVVLVWVCGQRYALSVDEVVEVAAMLEVAPLEANSNPALHGVVIRRGEPLLLVDLRWVLRCADAPIDLNTLFVVVTNGYELVGLLVDRVEGVVYLHEKDVRAMRGGVGYVRGVVAHEGSLVQWLHPTNILKDTLIMTEQKNS